MTVSSRALLRAGRAAREVVLLAALALATSFAAAQALPQNAAEALQRGEALVETAAAMVDRKIGASTG